MVCSKCQKKVAKTELVTPAVKKKSEMYYGSHLGSSAGGGGTRGGDSKKSSATLGNTGVSKNKLLSKKAQNPYAAYSNSCESCSSKTSQGWKYCQTCSYRKQLCAMCGKSLNASGASKAQPIVQGQKFNSK
ncbi:cript family protein [Trichophyton tonsurans CBS 112818]|uniref:Cysteine-rich PDZ-binding protein n=3 Tax=Trichophyton TaxID=5550 RepID=A0A059JC39_TRIIM|nr:cript family protein [Trichophyton tonsurans CBS 112818]EGE04296.1 hypothetical protein TEQG_03326 [Trichophyton equinum CBS 127.97]EZF29975.1 hypothetical protein H101_06377 [Trichophyton interdigitale H6]KDB25203.1 hypothetical protein H109_02931 [Trichophyton interdigitale MR816]